MINNFGTSYQYHETIMRKIKHFVKIGKIFNLETKYASYSDTAIQRYSNTVLPRYSGCTVNTFSAIVIVPPNDYNNQADDFFHVTKFQHNIFWIEKTTKIANMVYTNARFQPADGEVKRTVDLPVWKLNILNKGIFFMASAKSVPLPAQRPNC